MTTNINLRFFKGYPFLGKEEESKVKRDILKKLSRRFKNHNNTLCCYLKNPNPFAGHASLSELRRNPHRLPLQSELMG
jgi:hypothetical protein